MSLSLCPVPDGLKPFLEVLRIFVTAALQSAAQQHGSTSSGQHGQRKVSEQSAGAAGQDGKVSVKH